MDAANRLDLKIRLRADPQKLFKCLTADGEREKYWAEKSVELDGKIFFTFPNGITIHSRIITTIPPRIFEIEYFDSLVRFEIFPLPENGCILELINERIPDQEWSEQYAGWVSVLMSLKAYVDFGVDLRNHHPEYTWDQMFIDN
ncbi:MAG: hypothetical protein KFF73_15335 [Cyclobacteriaceae bacterium]|nr:hypothetical protein [Cyclobacteriaceae bacterium]